MEGRGVERVCRLWQGVSRKGEGFADCGRVRVERLKGLWFVSHTGSHADLQDPLAFDERREGDSL